MQYFEIAQREKQKTQHHRPSAHTTFPSPASLATEDTQAKAWSPSRPGSTCLRPLLLPSAESDTVSGWRLLTVAFQTESILSYSSILFPVRDTDRLSVWSRGSPETLLLLHPLSSSTSSSSACFSCAAAALCPGPAPRRECPATDGGQ